MATIGKLLSYELNWDSRNVWEVEFCWDMVSSKDTE